MLICDHSRYLLWLKKPPVAPPLLSSTAIRHMRAHAFCVVILMVSCDFVFPHLAQATPQEQYRRLAIIAFVKRVRIRYRISRPTGRLFVFCISGDKLRHKADPKILEWQIKPFLRHLELL